jgi:uncharacterized protein (DUF488 family)
MLDSATVYTIGFTQTSAEKFFGRLVAAGVRNVLDVRLHNTSQLAGFAKADDLAFFLNRIGGIGYTHMPILAPDDDMLADYKKRKGLWADYEVRFLNLMSRRKIESMIDPTVFQGACLLCSEHTPHHCHRRLVCDYLNSKWDNRLLVKHL